MEGKGIDSYEWAAQRFAFYSIFFSFKYEKPKWIIITNLRPTVFMFCLPYGLSVRVNAKDALPDELKYKDWDTGGSEQIELNLTPRVYDGRATWKRPRRESSRVRPDATP